MSNPAGALWEVSPCDLSLLLYAPLWRQSPYQGATTIVTSVGGQVSQTLSNARAPAKLPLYHHLSILTGVYTMDVESRDTRSSAGP